MDDQQRDHSFLGTGWAFPVRFEDHGERSSVALVGGVADIEESLRILLETLPGERVTNLEYGCRLRDLLFEPLSGSIPFRMREAIANAVEKFEPRIELDDVGFEREGPASGMVYLTLNYRVKSTNSRYNLVFPFSELEANYQTNA